VKDPASPPVEALVAAARAQYAAALPGKVEALLALARAGSWEDLRRGAHRLRGSAATYGFPEVGARAGEVEEVLLVAAGPPSAEGRARLETALDGARAQAERAAGATP
jgi:HPt (histidine-containing phosphotransfer) domain-containing protein